MKRVFYIVIFILVLVGIIFLARTVPEPEEGANNPQSTSTVETEYVSYKSSEYSPAFIYPKSWGEVVIKEGNKICPQEDTYRTSDTLHVFDWEFSFNDIKLPGSQSFIRTGIRTYELDPKNPNDCGDDFHLKIAQKQVIPESLSSFMLNSVTIEDGVSGTYNKEASRLNTEHRVQYTFFVSGDSVIHVVQPYLSFIPYFDSPELNEMEQDFGGDMGEYINKGKTSENIRKHLEGFKKMAESLNFFY